MRFLTLSRNFSSALIASLVFALLVFPVQSSRAITPGASGCELTGVNGPTSPGTDSNPYKVSSPEELAEVVDCDSFTTRHFQMTNDIDLQGVAWKPIGAGGLPNDNVSSAFSGQFDGQGFKITNLLTSDGYSGGLFGAVSGNSPTDRSSVKNLRIQGKVYSGAFGLKVQSASFSNVILNVDVFRNPAATSRTKLGAFAPEGFQVNASSISIEAEGQFGLLGVVGDSSVTAVGGMFASTGKWNNDPTPNIFSRISIRTYVGGAKPSVDLAGVIHNPSGNTEIRDSKVHVTLDSYQAGTTYQLPDIGGVVGANSTTDLLTISATTVHALIVLPYSSYSPYIDFYAGGVVGIGSAQVVSVSAVTHFHVPPNVNYGNNSYIGGIFGVSGGSSSVNQSYVSLSVTRDATNTSNIKMGNMVGYLGSTTNLAGSGNIFNNSASSLVTAATGGSNVSATSTLTATGIGFDQVQPSYFASVGWDMAASSNTFDSQTAWNICDHPYPTSSGQQGCETKILGGKVSRNGQGFELFFSSPLDAAQTPNSTALSIQTNGSQTSIDPIRLSSFGISNSRAVSFSNQAEFDSGVVVRGAYTAPLSGPVFNSETGRQVSDLGMTRFANSSFLVPPTAAISLVSTSVTSASVQVLCSTDCGDGTTFTYSIEVEKQGSGVSDLSVNDSGLLSGLSPSTSYTAKATVTYNGRTSTLVSLNFSTLRPVATISTVTLNGQQIEAVLGCVNCGAEPTSFSLIATPTGAGSVATSSTPIISGLATGTSYSISVRISYLGAESLEVTWSQTILTAVDPMPVIASVTPSSLLTSGGTEVIISGQNLASSSVHIDGVQVTPIVISGGTEIRFSSPVGTAGTSTLRVTNSGGYTEASLTFTSPPASQSGAGGGPSLVVSTPEITQLSKTKISSAGDQVAATGLRLGGITTLTLGGITVTVVSNTDTTLVFTTGEMPVGVWDLKLVGANGTIVYQGSIEVVEIPTATESTGELVGWSLTLRFLGNSRSLNASQVLQIDSSVRKNVSAKTVICWGYTTAENPKPWAIAHATARAKAACDQVLANNSQVRAIVRLRYGVPKDFAMRAALQFWK